ncbi:hypothetical protein K491DRAFT_691821 [Lophiostoma macrostomum CBS 122681]|uniref:CBF1-interacting co-repressor CIR N-terminal domain-containing protein n=1 Tax=Lophiostoma macrostomum CBS 122681 TaxID=1314788 RepID=A0A6A6T9C9_9PLEO|nr:hypothetical protein K491DRAFT_691821 [Lophiostoma macrostomum CBS 122681]
MGGDLNLKKSWHPNLHRNQEKVWKEEQKALEERKQIEKLRRERDEERSLEALQRLQEASGGRTVQKKVDWMYAGPSGDGAQVTEEREGYLLGKRRIDGLLKANDASSQTLSRGAAASIDTLGNSNANSALDVKMKVAQDPLLAIQKQRMEMQLKLMKDAQRKAKSEEKHAKEKERKRHHKHHRHSHRDRSRSRDSSDDRSRRHRHSRRDRSRSRDSSDERDRRHRHRHRSRSPRRRDHDDRDEYPRRSRSPRRREHRDERDDYRKRSRSPYRRQERPARDDYRSRSSRTSDDAPPKPAPTKPTQSADNKQDKQSAAEKLAQMQANASSLEEQRNERVRQIEAQDKVEEERHRQNREGGRKFISGMRSQATDMSLGDAMARGRHGARKEIDV